MATYPTAYFTDNTSSRVYLDKIIQLEEVTDIDKITTTWNKTMQSNTDEKLCGIIALKGGVVKLFNNYKFKAYFFQSRKSLSGNWNYTS